MKRTTITRKTSSLPESPSAAATTPGRGGFVPPYAPSWINRFADRIDRFPGPAWAYYLGAALLLAALQLGVQWSAGTYPVGSIEGFNLIVAVTVPYMLGLMHYLIRTSAGALEEFGPALRASPAEGAELKFRLTTLPARGTFLAGLGVMVGALLIVLLSSLGSSLGWRWLTNLLGENFIVSYPQIFRISASPASLGVTGMITLASWWTTGAFSKRPASEWRAAWPSCIGA